MQKNFSNYSFVLVDSKRLDFRDSRQTVHAFIKNRLAHFSIGQFKFIDSWNELSDTMFESLEISKETNGFIAVIDTLNPFIDFDLIYECASLLDRTKKVSCLTEGAVPGTEPYRVYSIANFRNCTRAQHIEKSSFNLDLWPIATFKSVAQTKYNNQLNLYKYKRLKLFIALIENAKDIFSKSIVEIFEILSSKEIHQMLVGFGEDVKLEHHENCPHCSARLHPLQNTMSQPFCGYLSNELPIYHECESCGLVVASPFIDADDLHKMYDVWDKQDFVASTNNPYTEESVRCDFTTIVNYLPEKTRSLDLGGGIGNFSKFLSRKFPKWDITHSDFEIKAKVEGSIQNRTLNFTRDPIGVEQYDLITAWEVIEHIPFHLFKFVLENIYRALKPGGFFKFSTPDFDSAACKSFDFYALCPPFHYTVLSRSWIERYFENSKQFSIFDQSSCSDFLDDASNWYGYGEKTAPSSAVRNTASVLKAIFEFDTDGRIKKHLLEQGFGTEICITLRKL
jgi:SAM-dependent methyltransferase